MLWFCTPLALRSMLKTTWHVHIHPPHTHTRTWVEVYALSDVRLHLTCPADAGSVRKLNTLLCQPRSMLLGFSLWRAAALAVLLWCGLWALLWLTWGWARVWILHTIVWTVQSQGGPLAPIPVDGQFSQFTILVMSYDKRELTLDAFVHHYDKCPSVASILVVWNKGVPPPLDRWADAQVPVTVRVEKKNSINNRFKPDPSIRTRAVLQLDDDILLPCSDIGG